MSDDDTKQNALIKADTRLAQARKWANKGWLDGTRGRLNGAKEQYALAGRTLDESIEREIYSQAFDSILNKTKNYAESTSFDVFCGKLIVWGIEDAEFCAEKCGRTMPADERKAICKTSIDKLNQEVEYFGNKENWDYISKNYFPPFNRPFRFNWVVDACKHDIDTINALCGGVTAL